MVNDRIQASADSEIKTIYSPTVIHIIVWKKWAEVFRGQWFWISYPLNFTISNILVPRSILKRDMVHFLTIVILFKCFLLCTPTQKYWKRRQWCSNHTVLEKKLNSSTESLGHYKICSDSRHSMSLTAARKWKHPI